MTMPRRTLVALGVAAALVGAAPATAQLIPKEALTGRATPAGRPDAFGTAGLSVLTMGAFDMSVLNSGHTWDWVSTKSARYLTNAGSVDGAVHLPSGALVEKIELEACDTTGGGEVIAGFVRQAVPIGSTVTEGLIETGTVATPGCNVFPLTLPTPVTIDNKNNLYVVEMVNNTFDGTTVFAAMRIYWRYQVAPAPATQTFGDVPPNHPFYKVIEALAASGITSGCGGGNFCPDQVVTRDQMAKFLANALGLYWAN